MEIRFLASAAVARLFGVVVVYIATASPVDMYFFWVMVKTQSRRTQSNRKKNFARDSISGHKFSDYVWLIGEKVK